MIVKYMMRGLMVAVIFRGVNPFRAPAAGYPFIRRTLTTRKQSLVDNQLKDSVTERNRLATELLTAARQVGQVGKRAPLEERQKLDQLALQLQPFSDPQPARIPFTGTHSLVYSGSDSGPTSGLIGPFVGKVTQVFHNETVYQNRVRFGPLQVSIFGRRQPLSDTEIQVGFYRTQIHMWDKLLVDRHVDLWRNPGSWQHIFVGQVEVDGESLLLRVMNTPKLFILQQPI
ncbi:expressed unknown protein [Seminavis robusta]|uniref:Uncharacterized protein n=1 Tax=Seminavis robusta TaxID=568900 RepID=A0A9N8E568_9STRA|nr:expressed unknown protein [Seminavis robusta]|eukprot:Sro671_g184940.1 n/a (229) ;mRNA; r:41312-41998